MLGIRWVSILIALALGFLVFFLYHPNLIAAKAIVGVLVAAITFLMAEVVRVAASHFINSLLNRPNVRLEGLGKKMSFCYNRNGGQSLECWVQAKPKNLSGDKVGHINDAKLVIFASRTNHIEVPCITLNGTVLQPYEALTGITLRFEKRIPDLDNLNSIRGARAQIHLDVGGQKNQVYEVRMHNQPDRVYQ